MNIPARDSIIEYDATIPAIATTDEAAIATMKARDFLEALIKCSHQASPPTSIPTIATRANADPTAPPLYTEISPQTSAPPRQSSPDYQSLQRPPPEIVRRARNYLTSSGASDRPRSRIPSMTTDGIAPNRGGLMNMMNLRALPVIPIGLIRRDRAPSSRSKVTNEFESRPTETLVELGTSSTVTDPIPLISTPSSWTTTSIGPRPRTSRTLMKPIKTTAQTARTTSDSGDSASSPVG